MSLFTSLYGSGAGAPIGATIFSPTPITDPEWLPLDGAVRLKASYPSINTTNMVTFDGQSFTTGVTLSPAGQYRIISCGAAVWYAYHSNGTGCHRSTDNGVTWTSGTLPTTVTPGTNYAIYFANGMFFCMYSGTAPATGGNGYWTSTDGLTWTSRSGLQFAFNSVAIAYVSGRYVAIPIHSGTSGGAFSYSADGITWTYATGTIGTSVTTSFQGICQAKLPVSPKFGAVVASNGYTYTSTTGLRWDSTIVGSVYGSGASYSIAAPCALDAFGDVVDAGWVLSSINGAGARRNARSGFAPLPLNASNIALSQNGIALSEDHGIAVHLTNVPCTNWLGADFNGSRLVCCSATGVISYIDVSSTKFRAARIPLEAGFHFPGMHYMKVS